MLGANWMIGRREFKSFGAAVEKALSLSSWFCPWSLDRQQVSDSVTGGQDLCDVGWGRATKQFVNKQKDFKIDFTDDREPVKGCKNACDVSSLFWLCQNSSCCISNELETG